MPTRRTSLKLASGLLLLLAAACSESPANLDSGGLGLFPETSTLSVFLTDAPGGVDAVWADIEQLTIQGDAGKFDLIQSPTGLIEITQLINGHLEQLVEDAQLPAGTYTSLRAIIGDAVLIDEAGAVFVKGTPDLGLIPDLVIPDVLGDLSCPSCTSSGFKVILPGGQTVLEDGVSALVLDFDITQSFGKASGGSGGWVMDPVIIATKVRDANGDGNINDDLALEASLSGTVQLAEYPVVFLCGDYVPSVQDFVPTATAQNLMDGTDPIVRTGTVGPDGTFTISPMQADVYDLGFIPTVQAGESSVTFDFVEVNLASVEVVGGPVDGVVYTIHSISCGF